MESSGGRQAWNPGSSMSGSSMPASFDSFRQQQQYEQQMQQHQYALSHSTAPPLRQYAPLSPLSDADDDIAAADDDDASSVSGSVVSGVSAFARKLDEEVSRRPSEFDRALGILPPRTSIPSQPQPSIQQYPQMSQSFSHQASMQSYPPSFGASLGSTPSAQSYEQNHHHNSIPSMTPKTGSSSSKRTTPQRYSSGEDQFQPPQQQQQHSSAATPVPSSSSSSKARTPLAPSSHQQDMMIPLTSSRLQQQQQFQQQIQQQHVGSFPSPSAAIQVLPSSSSSAVKRSGGSSSRKQAQPQPIIQEEVFEQEEDDDIHEVQSQNGDASNGSTLPSPDVLANTLREEELTRLRSTADSLKIELDMWQQAYRDAQTRHAQRIETLLLDFQSRESNLKVNFDKEREQMGQGLDRRGTVAFDLLRSIVTAAQQSSSSSSSSPPSVEMLSATLRSALTRQLETAASLLPADASLGSNGASLSDFTEVASSLCASMDAFAEHQSHLRKENIELLQSLEESRSQNAALQLRIKKQADASDEAMMKQLEEVEAKLHALVAERDRIRSSCDQQVHDLREELKTAKQVNADCMRQMKAMEEKSRNSSIIVSSNLGALEERIKHREEELAAAHSAAKETRDALASELQHRQTLEAKLRAMSSLEQTSRDQVKHHLDIEKELESDLHKTKDKASTLEQDLNEARSQCATLLRDLNREREAASRQADVSHMECVREREAREKWEKMYSDLHVEYSGLRDSEKDLKRLLAESEMNASRSLNDLKSSYSRQISDMEQENSRRQTLMDELRNALQLAAETSDKERRDHSDDLRLEMERRESEVSKIRSEMDTLRDAAVRAEERSALYLAQLEAARHEIAKAKREFKKLAQTQNASREFLSSIASQLHAIHVLISESLSSAGGDLDNHNGSASPSGAHGLIDSSPSPSSSSASSPRGGDLSSASASGSASSMMMNLETAAAVVQRLLDQVATGIVSLRSRCNKSMDDLISMQRDRRQVEMEYESELGKLQQQLQVSSAASDGLKGQLESTVNKLDSQIREEMAAREEEQRLAKERVEELQRKLEAENREKDAVIADLKGSLDMHRQFMQQQEERSRDQLESLKREMSVETSVLHQESEALRREVESLQARLRYEQETAADTADDVLNLRSMVETLQQRYSDKTRELADVRESYEAEMQRLTSQLYANQQQQQQQQQQQEYMPQPAPAPLPVQQAAPVPIPSSVSSVPSSPARPMASASSPSIQFQPAPSSSLSQFPPPLSLSSSQHVHQTPSSASSASVLPVQQRILPPPSPSLDAAPVSSASSAMSLQAATSGIVDSSLRQSVERILYEHSLQQQLQSAATAAHSLEAATMAQSHAAHALAEQQVALDSSLGNLRSSISAATRSVLASQVQPSQQQHALESSVLFNESKAMSAADLSFAQPPPAPAPAAAVLVQQQDLSASVSYASRVQIERELSDLHSRLTKYLEHHQQLEEAAARTQGERSTLMQQLEQLQLQALSSSSLSMGNNPATPAATMEGVLSSRGSVRKFIEHEIEMSSAKASQLARELDQSRQELDVLSSKYARLKDMYLNNSQKVVQQSVQQQYQAPPSSASRPPLSSSSVSSYAPPSAARNLDSSFANSSFIAPEQQQQQQQQQQQRRHEPDARLTEDLIVQVLQRIQLQKQDQKQQQQQSQPKRQPQQQQQQSRYSVPVYEEDDDDDDDQQDEQYFENDGDFESESEEEEEEQVPRRRRRDDASESIGSPAADFDLELAQQQQQAGGEAGRKKLKKRSGTKKSSVQQQQQQQQQQQPSSSSAAAPRSSSKTRKSAVDHHNTSIISNASASRSHQQQRPPSPFMSVTVSSRSASATPVSHHASSASRQYLDSSHASLRSGNLHPSSSASSSSRIQPTPSSSSQSSSRRHASPATMTPQPRKMGL